MGLIEAWQNGGIPLQAGLRGIDVAFEKWRKRPAQARIEMVNCPTAVRRLRRNAGADKSSLVSQHTPNPPVPIEGIRSYVNRKRDGVSASRLSRSRYRARKPQFR